MKTLPIPRPVFRGHEFSPRMEASKLEDLLRNCLHDERECLMFYDERGAYFPKGYHQKIISIDLFSKKTYIHLEDGISVELTKDIILDNFLYLAFRTTFTSPYTWVWKIPVYEASGTSTNDQEEYFRGLWSIFEDTTMIEVPQSELQPGDVVAYYIENALEVNWITLITYPDNEGWIWFLNDKGFPERLNTRFDGCPLHFYRYI